MTVGNSSTNSTSNVFNVRKRDGSIQQFDPEKYMRVISWACENEQVYIDALKKEVDRQLYDGVSTQHLMNTLIHCSETMISLIQPKWEVIGARLVLLRLYHNKAGHIAFHKEKYPKIEDILNGPEYMDFFDEGEFRYTDEDCAFINNHIIKQSNDFNFKFSGLQYMITKYLHKNELPQHTFARAAMFLFMKEDKKKRLSKIKKFYDYLSNFYFTLATPLLSNSGLKNPQLASCVLMTMGDNIESIMEAMSDAAIYSKFKGGLSVNFENIRESGSPIKGNGGVSSGPVPFIKLLEQSTSAFSQGGLRKGAAVANIQWYHPDIFSVLAMKRNGTPEEFAARHTQFCVSLDQYFLDAVEKNEDVYLISPTADPMLQKTYGEEFNKRYKKCVEKGEYIKKVNARDLWHEMMITRVDTGNLYLFHKDNVNSVEETKRFGYVSQTNLCTEILEPTRESGDETKQISLCTLASVNIEKYSNSPCNIRDDIISCLVEALDNTFDIADYPVEGVKEHALNYRFLGIGMFNYAYMIASRGLKFNNSLDVCEHVVKDWSDRIKKKSEDLAEEKGPYLAYKPEHGKPRRNALLMAIAPTASSARITGGTEGIDPILKHLTRLSGTATYPHIVPEFNRFSKYYETAFDIDPIVLLDHAIMRQKYIDQSQSVNIYTKDLELKSSSGKLFKLHKYGFDNGLKTLYYFTTEKETHKPDCESCT